MDRYYTDQEIHERGFDSRAAFNRRMAQVEAQAKRDAARAANTVDTGRSSCRFNPPDDQRIVAEHQRLRASHQVAKGGVIQPAPIANVIPFLDPTSERQAA
jgi:hypothetical protein